MNPTTFKRRMHPLLKDGLALGIIVLTLLWQFAPWVLHSHPRYLYVATQGSDWSFGRSPERPLATLRRAVELAQPGTIITVRPGRYHERLFLRKGGVPDAPIIFRAEKPGTVIFSGGVPSTIASELLWRPEGNGIFSTRTPWSIYAFFANEERLLHCRTEKAFRQFVIRPLAYGAFFQIDNRLLLRLRHGANPDNAVLAFNGPVPHRLANGVWRAANVWLEASHFRFEGIRFELGAGSGISLFRSNNLDIRECVFTGADIGIDASKAVPGRIDLSVRNCASLNYPAGEWQPRWLSWQECYTHQRNRGFINVGRDGVIVQGNLITGASDGMHISPSWEGSQSDWSGHGADISGNLIALCNDDAIEFDGFAENVSFHHNLIYDCPMSLGVSPVLRGPVIIAYNLFLHPSDRAYACQIKFLNPWQHRQKPLNGPIRNIEIHHNTFVSDWLCWHRPDTPVVDVRVHHNRFAVQRCGDPAWPPGVHEYSNDYINLPIDAYPNPGRDERWFSGVDFARKKSVLVDNVRDAHGDIGCAYGAVQPGEKWAIKCPGPSWFDWRSDPGARRLLNELDARLFE